MAGSWIRWSLTQIWATGLLLGLRIFFILFQNSVIKGIKRNSFQSIAITSWIKCSTLMFLHCQICIYFGGRQGIFIFHAWYITKWSLKQSESVPDWIIFSGWDTHVKFSRDDDASVTLIGSIISWIKFIQSNFIIWRGMRPIYVKVP